jgi:nitrogen regulatory protein P-II 1
MKKIETLLRPAGFEELEKVLKEFSYPGITFVTSVEYKKSKSISWQWGQLDFKVKFLPELKLEILGPDDLIESLLKSKLTVEIPRSAA